MVDLKRGDIISPLSNRTTSNGISIKNIKEAVVVEKHHKSYHSRNGIFYNLISIKITKTHNLSEQIGQILIIRSDAVKLIKSITFYEIY